jgi:hypothetical protein
MSAVLDLTRLAIWHVKELLLEFGGCVQNVHLPFQNGLAVTSSRMELSA